MNSMHTAASAPPSEPPSIVSVNSRGGASSGMAAKVAFCLLVVAVVAIGALIGFNKHRAAQAKTEHAEALAAKAESVPASSTARRTFNTDPPAPPAANTAAPPAFSLLCPDGSGGQPLLGPDGQVIAGPKGQPMRVCPGGGLVVPALQPMPSDAPSDTGVHANGAATGAVPRVQTSRYGGDVMVVQSARPTPAAPLAPGQSTLADEPQRDVQRSNAGVTSSVASMATRRESGQQGDLGSLLSGDRAAVVSATMIGDRDMIVPQGRTIDCNLSMRLVNDVSGKATCVLSSNVYSDSGRVVLAERGSTATGEYVAMMAQGQRRLFVLWTRIQTPSGVVIDINSPAADALGTSGLPGDIDNRWRDRIGAAVLLSLVEDAIGYQTAKVSGGDGGSGAQGIAVLQSSTQTGRSLAERILDSTINIKPTLYKNQGDRATIFVSRDLDFGRVYALRAK